MCFVLQVVFIGLVKDFSNEFSAQRGLHRAYEELFNRVFCSKWSSCLHNTNYN